MQGRKCLSVAVASLKKTAFLKKHIDKMDLQMELILLGSTAILSILKWLPKERHLVADKAVK